MMQKVLFNSAQDKLAGTLYEPSAAGKYAGVLFTHGLLSCQLEWGNYPETLSRLGYVTLAYDLRGHGESGGQRGYISLARGMEDIRAGLDLLARLPNVDAARLALVGHSLGAALSICAAATDARVKALVAIAPPASIRLELKPGEAALYAIAGAVGSIYKSVTGRSLYLPYRVGTDDLFHHESARRAARANDFLQHASPHENTSSLVSEMEAVTCAPSVVVPTLVMRGEHDRVVSTSRMIYEKLGGPKDFEVVRDSGHSIMMDGHGNEAFQCIANWLGTHLGNGMLQAGSN